MFPPCTDIPIDVDPIPDLPGYYVSRDGAFYSTARGRFKKLKQQISKAGYFTVFIAGRRRILVHRALAKTYLPNPHQHPQINHKDGIKLNNSLENLEWCTQSHNTYHALRTGLHPTGELAIIGWNPKTGEGHWFKSAWLASRMGFSQPNICMVLKNRRQFHRGFRWIYA